MEQRRQIRADYDDRTVVVYQAYSDEIAEPALAAGTFVPPFKPGRMTWVKPSFLWMAYRCGWARKPGQERVLAVRVLREAFDEAVRSAVPSREVVRGKPEIRVQWDPERGLRHEALEQRSLQLGLGGDASRRYVEEWITGLVDVTGVMRRVGAAVAAGELELARELLPVERVYPLEV
ncbi:MULTISPECIES: DUF4291 domain-containing protein [Actinosynnema]|uniref:DUF4291 domain-containing protein n=1 Tax=Actinosynnema TaxID=40566 RepID=UPI0020A5655B|nr:DUF4291 domain-containing protein [Actinosynnema pretiosum]MCP2096008.1 protein of unknown function (DUF4291) [Actinosynnema pretiosum]